MLRHFCHIFTLTITVLPCFKWKKSVKPFWALPPNTHCGAYITPRYPTAIVHVLGMSVFCSAKNNAPIFFVLSPVYICKYYFQIKKVNYRCYKSQLQVLYGAQNKPLMVLQAIFYKYIIFILAMFSQTFDCFSIIVPSNQNFAHPHPFYYLSYTTEFCKATVFLITNLPVIRV